MSVPYLPSNVMMILWSLCGPVCLFFRCDFLKDIQENRREFLDSPLLLHYRLLRIKRKSGARRPHSCCVSHSVYRPSIYLEGIQLARIEGGIHLGDLMQTGKILPSKALKKYLLHDLPQPYVHKLCAWDCPQSIITWDVGEVVAHNSPRAKRYTLVWRKF